MARVRNNKQKKIAAIHQQKYMYKKKERMGVIAYNAANAKYERDRYRRKKAIEKAKGVSVNRVFSGTKNAARKREKRAALKEAKLVASKKPKLFDEQQYRKLVIENSAACPNCNYTIGTNLKHCWACRASMCRTSCRSSRRNDANMNDVGSFQSTNKSSEPTNADPNCEERASASTRASEKCRYDVTEEEQFTVRVQSRKYRFSRGVVHLPSFLGKDNFHEIYLDLFNSGYQKKKQNKGIEESQRRDQMSLYGSTIMASNQKYLFENPKKKNNNGKTTRSPLPRLNFATRLGGTGAWLLKIEWFIDFVHKMEELVMKHNPQLNSTLEEAKQIIPQELRLCDTCFTGLAIVGKLTSGKNLPHKDTRDVTSIIISFGNKDVLGGNTLYFNEKNDIVASTKFKHGRFQTGDFHDVQHSGDDWTGRRGIFSFYLNKGIFNHFKEHGDAPYVMHRETMYKI